MSAAGPFDGRYFDGLSAAAHDAQFVVDRTGVAIRLAERELHWSFRGLSFERSADGGYRLTHKSAPDAVLVAPPVSVQAFIDFAPNLFSSSAARRRFVMLAGSLVALSAALAAGLFIGVPAASGPLARATDPDIERQIGENLSAQIQLIMRPCKDDDAARLIEDAVNVMAERADVGFPISFTFVDADQPNAFALPGGHVSATAGLLHAVEDDQEAFFAVLAHELGHVRERHGMQAVYRNAGLGLLLEIITGGSGVAQQAVLVSGQLNQLRHTRAHERDADDAAYQIMESANLDPAALARAFDAILEVADDDGDDLPSWLNSHPDTKERIAEARERARPSGSLPLSDDDWGRVRKACAAD